ncbi:MAG: hypothetical protein HKN12_08265, partial [Gemmatimonadetes bacterium]|nr:hypothetical protein [Gemmatimonadota bacterium]
WIAYEFLRALREERSFLRNHLALIVLLNLKSPLLLVAVAAELVFFLASPHHRGQIGRWVRPLLLAVPLGAGWFVVQGLRDPEGFRYVVNLMFSELSTGRREPQNNFVYYFHVLMYGLFPYVLILPAALVLGVRGAGPERRDFEVLIRCFAGAVLVFFLIVQKKFPWYVMPAYPFFAMVLGTWTVRFLRSGAAYRFWWALLFVPVLIGMLGFEPRVPDPLARALLTFPRPTLAEGWWRDVAPIVVAVALMQHFLPRVGPAEIRFQRVVVAVALVCLPVLASLRVAASLPVTPVVSANDRLRTELRRRETAGETTSFPMLVKGPHSVARYYFGDAYDVGRKLGGRRVPHLIGPKGGVRTGDAEPVGDSPGESGDGGRKLIPRRDDAPPVRKGEDR